MAEADDRCRGEAVGGRGGRAVEVASGKLSFCKNRPPDSGCTFAAAGCETSDVGDGDGDVGDDVAATVFAEVGLGAIAVVEAAATFVRGNSDELLVLFITSHLLGVLLLLLLLLLLATAATDGVAAGTEGAPSL